MSRSHEMKRGLLLAVAILLLPASAQAHGGAALPALLLYVITAPVALIAAAITWHFVPQRFRGDGLQQRIRNWIGLAFIYSLILLAVLVNSCGP